MRLERDTLGREIARQQGSLFSQFQYDPAGRLQRHRVVHGQSKATLIQRNYGYNAQGALSLIQDLKKGDTRFHYDALERLTQVEGYIQEQFQFDPAGNLLGYQANNQNMADNGQSRGNRLAFFGDRKFEYDERGNLIRERRGKDGRLVTHYQYNAANQLVAVEKVGRRTEYRYDPLGRRIAKIGPDSTTNFLWNGDVLAWEQKGPDKTLYVYEPNSFRPLAQIRNGDIYHYHLDHLGTPQELTDAHGNLAWSVRYRAYGNVVRKEVEFVENNLRFQGQYYDAESGLHYNRFRYYDPGTGQFTTQDPIGLLGGENSYRYVSNPVQWIDPTGLTASKESSTRAQEALQRSKPDFYVGPSGPASTLPATAYRYDRYLNDDGTPNTWGEKIIANKEGRVTYFGFDKYNTGAEASDAFQIKTKKHVNPLDPQDRSWSDSRLRSEFDTLQLYENGVPTVKVPTAFGNKVGAPPEPFTAAYPNYGKGGAQQLHADGKTIKFDKVDILPEN